MKRFLSDEKYLMNAFLRAGDQLGIDYKRVFKALGLSRVLLNSPEAFIPSHLFNRVLETIANDDHCHDIALHIAQNLTTPHLGLAAKVAAFSLDLRSGLAHAQDYNLYYQDTGCWRHHLADQQVCLYKPGTPFCSHYNSQRHLLGTAQIYLLLEQLTGGLWQPSAVSFSFPDPGYRFTDTFESFFACELAFDQDKDAIYFPEDDLDVSLTTADLGMLRSVETQINELQMTLFEDQDILGRARLVLDQRLRFSACTEPELAQLLGLSAAQLHNELSQANTDFSRLYLERCADRATFYIRRFNAPTDLVCQSLSPDNPEQLAQFLVARG